MHNALFVPWSLRIQQLFFSFSLRLNLPSSIEEKRGKRSFSWKISRRKVLSSRIWGIGWWEESGKNPRFRAFSERSRGRTRSSVDEICRACGVYFRKHRPRGNRAAGNRKAGGGGGGGRTFQRPSRFSSSVKIPKPGARECYNLKLPGSTTRRGIVVFRAVERET